MSDLKKTYIYTFSLDREVETEKSEESEVNGEKVKITKKVKEKQPVVFGLKRPNRKLLEKADMFYGVQLSEGIRAGLLTKALLVKRYKNDGGILSDADATFVSELETKFSQLENEHQRLNANLEKLSEDQKQAKIREILEQKKKIVQSLQDVETINQAIFAHTAESKAQAKLNNWWIVHLAYWDQNNKENFVEFFPGATFDEKMAKWDEIDENTEPYVLEAVARFALLIGLWNAGARTEEELKEGENNYASILAAETVQDKPAPVDKPATETPPVSEVK